MLGNSLVVQWLRLQASISEGTGLIPGQGTKILNSAQNSEKKMLVSIQVFSKLSSFCCWGGLASALLVLTDQVVVAEDWSGCGNFFSFFL